MTFRSRRREGVPLKLGISGDTLLPSRKKDHGDVKFTVSTRVSQDTHLIVEPFDGFHKHFLSVLEDLSSNGYFQIPRASISQWAGTERGSQAAWAGPMPDTC